MYGVTVLHLSCPLRYSYPFYKSFKFLKHWQFTVRLFVNKATMYTIYWSVHRIKVFSGSLRLQFIKLFNTLFITSSLSHTIHCVIVTRMYECFNLSNTWPCFAWLWYKSAVINELWSTNLWHRSDDLNFIFYERVLAAYQSYIFKINKAAG
jgi:hypothetical protein